MNTVKSEKSLRAFVLCMLPGFVIMLLQNGAAIFCSQLYVVWMFFNADGKSENFGELFIQGIMSSEFLMTASLLYSAIGIVVFLLWYKKLSQEQNESHIPSDTLRGYPLYLYAGIIIFSIAAQVVCEYIVELLAKGQPQWLSEYEDIMSSLTPSGNLSDILIIFYSIILGPVCEELCFRGVTLILCRRVMSAPMSNIVQALFFGGMHAIALQSIYAFALGYLLGMIYLKTDNIMITILIHIIFNGIGVLFGSYIGTGNSPATFFIMLLTAMMCTYGGYVMIIKADLKKKTLSDA